MPEECKVELQVNEDRDGGDSGLPYLTYCWLLTRPLQQSNREKRKKLFVNVSSWNTHRRESFARTNQSCRETNRGLWKFRHCYPERFREKPCNFTNVKTLPPPYVRFFSFHVFSCGSYLAVSEYRESPMQFTGSWLGFKGLAKWLKVAQALEEFIGEIPVERLE